MRPAGTLLVKIARLLFDESVLSRVVYPTIADLQEEVREAGTDPRRRLLARWRGYRAFWVVVLAAPVACWSWPMTRESDRHALLSVSGLITAALIVVVLLTTGGAMADFGYAFELLPDAVAGMLDDAHVLAFMAGPAALVLLFAFRWLRGPVRFAVQPAEAALLTLLSATVVVTTGSAVFVNAFAGIARTGRAAPGDVLEAGVASIEALMYAAGVVAACALLVAALTLRAGRGRPTATAEPNPMPARLAVALSAVVCLSLVAVDLLLHTYYRALELLLAMFDPGRQAPGGIADTADLLAHRLGLLFVIGGVLTFFLIVAGAMVWRMSRARPPHPILTWASRTALAIVMVGAVWHAGEARAILDAYQELSEVNVPRPPVANRIPVSLPGSS